MNESGAPPPLADPCQESDLRILENEHLRVSIAPAQGGKILSLLSKRTGTEWLLPPLRSYAESRTTGGFDQWDGGGFDECLPTIAATGTSPDHGEVWRTPWTEDAGSGSAVTLRVIACDGNIELIRRASLEGAALMLDYRVRNVGSTQRRLLYSAHPLLRVESGDRIVLPPEVGSVLIEGSQGDRIGGRGRRIAWPIARGARGEIEDLSQVGQPDGLQADKLFAGPLSSGWCAVARPSQDEALQINFDSKVLPYLGIWICRAAWPETGHRKQYAVALEPTNSDCDSLEDAESNGTAWRLEPGEERAWALRFLMTSAAPADPQKGTYDGD